MEEIKMEKRKASEKQRNRRGSLLMEFMKTKKIERSRRNIYRRCERERVRIRERRGEDKREKVGWN